MNIEFLSTAKSSAGAPDIPGLSSTHTEKVLPEVHNKQEKPFHGQYIPEDSIKLLEREVEKNYQVEPSEEILFPEKMFNWLTAQIRGHKILDRESTLKLLETATGNDIEARNFLVLHNQRLVLSIANRYKSIANGTNALELKDLIQEGTLGLIKAITKFDLSLGCTLSTYATWWIRQTILHAIHDHSLMMRLPAHLYEQLNKYKKVCDKLESILGKKPNIDQIAEEMKLTTDQVFFIDKVYSRRYLSLDEPLFHGSEENELTLADLIEDSGFVLPHLKAHRRDLEEKLRRRLKVNLTIREYHIMEKRFGLDGTGSHSLQEIGDEFGVTRERIRQIHKRAMERLKRDPVVHQLICEALDKKTSDIPTTWKLPVQPLEETPVEVTEKGHKEDIVPAAEKKILGKKDSLVLEVVKIVVSFYGVSEIITYEETQEVQILRIQRIAMYILWHDYNMSYDVIGRNFGNKERIRVASACNRVEMALQKNDEILKGELEFIRKVLDASKSNIPIKN